MCAETDEIPVVYATKSGKKLTVYEIVCSEYDNYYVSILLLVQGQFLTASNDM